MGAFRGVVTEPRSGALPKLPTVPLASASQYPAPLGAAATPIVHASDATIACCQVRVMSLGAAQVLTTTAPMEPGSSAAPMESTGGCAPHEGKLCKMMSRCIQQDDGDAGVHAALVVGAPAEPSSYIHR
jgi:hypothetical protein